MGGGGGEPWVSHPTGLKAQVQDLVLSHSSRTSVEFVWCLGYTLPVASDTLSGFH